MFYYTRRTIAVNQGEKNKRAGSPTSLVGIISRTDAEQPEYRTAQPPAARPSMPKLVGKYEHWGRKADLLLR